MKFEALMVCVDYSDFLKLVIPANKEHFDNIVVITSFEDKLTQDLCKTENVRCFATDVFYLDNRVFNKGAALDIGLHHLKFNDWVCIMDADIIFPKNFRENIPWDCLNKDILYGGSRRFVWTYQDYVDLSNGIFKENELESIPGYGCGFAQIVNMSAKTFKQYPNLYPDSYDAGQVDIDFLKRFHPDVTTVGKLDFIALHLGPHGCNHKTRKNPRIPELKDVSFFEMPNVSNHNIYK